MPKKLGRPDQSQVARRLVTLFEYLKARGLFDEDGTDALAEVPLSELEDYFGYSRDILEGLLIELSCCSQCSYLFVPIDVDEERGVVTSYGLFAGFQKPLRLSEAECEALAAALSTVGVSSEDELFSRLVEHAGSMSAVPSDVAGPLVLPEASSHLSSSLSLLAEAIEQHRVVRFSYTHHSGGEPAVREVEPMDFSLDNGRWYLYGWCYLRQDFRTFLVDNMDSIEDAGRTFVPRSSDILRFDEALKTEFPLAAIDISPRASIEMRDWPGLSIVSAEADGTRHATIPWALTEWLPTQILSCLGTVVATSPEKLVSAVQDLANRKAADAQAALKAYGALSI